MITKSNFDEVKYREKLEKTIPNGAYQIGISPFIAYTGKGGKIDFEIALVKEMLNLGVTFDDTFYE